MYEVSCGAVVIDLWMAGGARCPEMWCIRLSVMSALDGYSLCTEYTANTQRKNLPKVSKERTIAGI